jgi:peptidyl-Asp metalloendopeptidase
MTRTLAFAVAFAGVAASSPAQALLSSAGPERAGDPGRPWVVRERPVHVRLSRLPGASARDAVRGVLPPPGHRLVLPLFDDVVVRARMTRSERHGRAFVWAGKVPGQPLGDVVLSVYDGVVSGSVVSSRGAFRIRFDGATHVVEEIDQDAFPEGNCVREVPPGEAAAAAEPGAAQPAAADDGSLVDVLVVYTPAARAAAGGTAAMLSLVNLGVAETNTAYANSGVVPRLRLAGAVEVAYAESGSIEIDLDRLTAPADGHLDGVHALRDAHRADLVSLVTQTPGSPYCGIAWLMAGNDPGFAPWAMSVVEQVCISPNYSFGHELGHNMGLNHARQDPVLPGAYPYSYGYKWPGYRTVMAYAPGLRILHFSNPGVFHLGVPTGVSETSPSSAHNALSLNNTRTTVANWRVSSSPAIRLDAPNGGEAWPAGSTRGIAWTATDLPAGAVVRIGYADGGARQATTGRPAGGPVAVVPAAQGSYSWTVPATPGSAWRVSLCVPGAPFGRGSPTPCLASDESDDDFAITP